MTIERFLCCFLCIFFGGAVVVCGSVSGQISSTPIKSSGSGYESDKQVVAKSIAECGVANLKGLRQGDLLLKKTELFDNSEIDEHGRPNGIIVRSTAFVRVAFDFEKGEYCSFSLRESSILDFAKSDKESKGFVLKGFCHSKSSDNFTELFLDDARVECSRKEFAESRVKFLGEIGFHDVRSLVVTGTMTPHPLFFTKGMPDMGVADVGDTFCSCKWTGSKVVILDDISPASWKDKDKKQLLKNEYDSESLMPTSMRLFVRRSTGSEKDLVSRKFDWSEHQGLLIPKSASISGPRTISVGDVRHSSTFDSDYEFHWFSVNEPKKLDQKLFDGSYFESRDSIVSQIDPTRLGINWGKRTKQQ